MRAPLFWGLCGARDRTWGFMPVGPTFSPLSHIPSPWPICCLKPARCWQPVTIATENQRGQALLRDSLGRIMAGCLSHCHGPSMAYSSSSDHVRGLNSRKGTGRGSWATPQHGEAVGSRSFPCSHMSHKIQMNQLFQGQSFNYLPAQLSADKNANSPLSQYKHKLTPSAF